MQKRDCLFNPVLVATDFSEWSRRALLYTDRLAGNAQLYAATAVDTFQYNFGAEREAERQELLNSTRNELLAWLNAQALLHRDNISPMVLEGQPSDAILRFVKQNSIALVALGTHGAKGAERLILGSVAEEILRLVPCPVLTVGPHTAIRQQPSSGPVLFPTDLNGASRAAISVATWVARTLGTKLKLLHLISPDIQSASERQRLRSYYESRLVELVPKAERDLLGGAIVEAATVAEGVVEFANAESAALIVMGVHVGGELDRAATHLPWTITPNVLAGAPCPVLTVKA